MITDVTYVGAARDVPRRELTMTSVQHLLAPASIVFLVHTWQLWFCCSLNSTHLWSWNTAVLQLPGKGSSLLLLNSISLKTPLDMINLFYTEPEHVPYPTHGRCLDPARAWSFRFSVVGLGAERPPWITNECCTYLC